MAMSLVALASVAFVFQIVIAERVHCAAATPAFASPPAWPQQGFDAQHSGRSTLPGPHVQPVTTWTFIAGEILPAVGADGTIYINTYDQVGYPSLHQCAER
jgi:hypothetical protein